MSGRRVLQASTPFSWRAAGLMLGLLLLPNCGRGTPWFPAGRCNDRGCILQSHDVYGAARLDEHSIAYAAAAAPCDAINQALRARPTERSSVVFAQWHYVDAGPDDDYTGLIFGNAIEHPAWAVADYLNSGKPLLVVQDSGSARSFVPPSEGVGTRDWSDKTSYAGLKSLTLAAMGPCRAPGDPIAAPQAIAAWLKDPQGRSCNQSRAWLNHVPASARGRYPWLPAMDVWRVGVAFAQVGGRTYTLYVSADYEPAYGDVAEIGSTKTKIDVVLFSPSDFTNVCVLVTKHARPDAKADRRVKESD